MWVWVPLPLRVIGFTWTSQWASIPSCVSCPTPCNLMDCSMPGFPGLYHLLEFAQTHVHWVGDATEQSHPLSPPSPSVLNLSQHQSLFQWVGFLHQMAKSIGASASFLPMNIQGWFPLELTGLISLQSTGLFKSLLQYHNLKASVLWHLAFFMVQFSQPYMTTGKTIALTLWTFVSKVIYLLFNMLSRFVIAFLPRSKHLLISWL